MIADPPTEPCGKPDTRPNACGACGPAPVEACDGEDNDCDHSVDESCDCIDESSHDCGGLGACRFGEQTCTGGTWSACEGGTAAAELCDAADNDCDGTVDEGCECIAGKMRDCGGLGTCRLGSQTCTDGSWSACEGGNASVELCDAADNDCDGTVDEGCECINARTRSCGVSLGDCEPGTQTCRDGRWSECSGGAQPALELCDGQDNDCDGNIDDGFDLTLPCDSRGTCPQTRVCSDDGLTSACTTDEVQFSDERCDGTDNDCDGLVDLIRDNGNLRSACTCHIETVSPGRVEDVSIEGDLNLCAETQCAGAAQLLEIDGRCYPICQSSSDPDGDGWGWESGASCVVGGSPRALAARPCSTSAPSNFMSISYCLDCSGTTNPPYAMCQSDPRFDLRAFGRGEEWLRVEYTYGATAPAWAPVNLWIASTDGRRKYLPLVNAGDGPGRYTKLLRVEDACFSAAAFAELCDGQGTACAHCAYDEHCGGIETCGQYDLSQSRLQVAAEYCPENSGQHVATVTVHTIDLVAPNCDE